MRRTRSMPSRAGMALGRQLLVLAAFAFTQAVYAQAYLGLGPTQNASAFRAQAGQTLSFICPASDGGKAKLYGTDVYTDDSPICAAAIHASALKAGRAGVVTILIGNGAKSFKGSDRNGIASHDYGAWGHSYSFVQDSTTGSISWKTVWNGIPDDFTDPIVVNCPSGGDASKAIWGTDVYTRDSTICVAAVHTGSITPEKGGLITVRRAPAPREYPGTQRYRVTSQRWGSSGDAFTVTAAVAPSLPPEESHPPSTSIAPRTITLAGFIAGGAPTGVAPRTIILAGFIASGRPGGIAPRTIALPGWTAAGS
ncbi:MAG: LCCL domain-containing protein [Steroidobacteraceae bacterium]